MAIVFMDGFDHYASGDRLKKWDREGGYIWGHNTIENRTRRRSGTSYLWIGRGHHLNKDVVDTDTGEHIYTCVVGAACYLGGPDIYGIGVGSIILRGPSGNLFVLTANGANGRVSLKIGGILVAETETDYCDILTWMHLELKVVIHPSAGSYEVRWNEEFTFGDSDIDTEVYEGQGIDEVILDNSGSGGFDDFYILDGNSPNNDFLGDCRIDTIYPNGAGAYSDFTPSAGTNYENVHDKTVDQEATGFGGFIADSFGNIDDDGTYNESAVVGNKDTYNHESPPSLPTTIYGITQNSCVRKTDAGRRYITQLIRTNSMDYYTVDEYKLTDFYKVIQRTGLDHNPNDSLPWEEADITTLQSGVKVTT